MISQPCVVKWALICHIWQLTAVTKCPNTWYRLFPGGSCRWWTGKGNNVVLQGEMLCPSPHSFTRVASESGRGVTSVVILSFLILTEHAISIQIKSLRETPLIMGFLHAIVWVLKFIYLFIPLWQTPDSNVCLQPFQLRGHCFPRPEQTRLVGDNPDLTGFFMFYLKNLSPLNLCLMRLMRCTSNFDWKVI